MPSSRSTAVPPHEAFALVFETDPQKGLRPTRVIVGDLKTKKSQAGIAGVEVRSFKDIGAGFFKSPNNKMFVFNDIPALGELSPTEDATEGPGVDLTLAEAAELGPRARAILHGRQIAAKDLKAAGGAYTQEEVRLLRGAISRQAIHKAVQDKRMLVVGPERMARRFPVIQFGDDGELIDGLREVQLALDTNNGFAVLNFLIQPHGDLDGKRPIDLLARGEVAPVVAVAESYGEHGQ